MANKALTQGAVGALVTAMLVIALPDTARLHVMAGLLWLTVGIYVGMALVDGPRALRHEALGGLPALVLATLGAVWQPWLLVAAWTLHPAWDLLHLRHRPVVPTKVHPVVVPFCITYDLGLAVLAAVVAAGPVPDLWAL